MSGFKGHVLGGRFAAAVYLVLLVLINLVTGWFAWLEFPIFVFLVYFGALWPDTDTGSTSRVYIYWFFILVDVVMIFGLKMQMEAALFGLFAMFPAIGVHRGWTHSKFWNFIMGLPLLGPSFLGKEFLADVEIYRYRDLYMFGAPYALSFYMGVISHLVLDHHPYFKNLRSKNFKGKKKKWQKHL